MCRGLQLIAKGDPQFKHSSWPENFVIWYKFARKRVEICSKRCAESSVIYVWGLSARNILFYIQRGCHCNICKKSLYDAETINASYLLVCLCKLFFDKYFMLMTRTENFNISKDHPIVSAMGYWNSHLTKPKFIYCN